ncbi:MAG: polyribonucleotide nucleotidyltransferase, partial [Gemmatimonadetes bacterium]|nr:polyribonucleotide nucleotidyltransferase [Gemmatimonadota bacterium]
MKVNKSIEIGGRTLSVETGRIAKQASGACLIQYGDTVVMVTAQASDKDDPSRDFLPLTVDYREKYYAAGKIPGGFFKREARPTEKETLSARQIDRPIRPLFAKGWSRETQVIANVLSSDQENDSDTLGLLGASMSLSLSSIPFNGPVGAVRIGVTEDGDKIVNPTFDERDECDLVLTVAGTKDAIVMVEGAAQEVPEQTIIDCLRMAQEEIQKIIQLQEMVLGEGVGKEKAEWSAPQAPEGMKEALESALGGRLKEALAHHGKHERSAAVRALRDEVFAQLADKYSEESDIRFLKATYSSMEKDILRKTVLETNVRADGRGLKDIRPISCEVGVLPRTHGSALFTRGETQAHVLCTLGTSADEQRIDGLEGDSFKSYYLHYNFPPYSVGEVRRMFSTSRREIGHGNLAERALRPVLPADEDFPYTV